MSLTQKNAFGDRSQNGRFVVRVNDGVIEAAIPANSGHCVYADAIKESYPAAKNVAVDIQTVRFTIGDKRYIFLTPRALQASLLRFDEGVKPQPSQFQLRNGQIIKAGRRKAKDGTTTPRARKLVGGHPNRGGLPRVRGGDAPPQMRMRREFGLRAFSGVRPEAQAPAEKA